jgi:orotidine-5'-phosphate decarboxylase
MIQAKDRIIVALDVDSIAELIRTVQELRPHVRRFKVGLEILTAVGAPRIMEALRDLDALVFFDGKFNDIPNTVALATEQVARLGVEMFDVHACSGEASLKMAAANKGASLLLAVTILTSFDDSGCLEIFGGKSETKVKEFALLAKRCGADGIVCSPHELAMLATLPQLNGFIRVTPGVRPAWADAGDQKRFMTPAQAVAQGATYLVIGRPITRPPISIGTPAQAVIKIIDEIEGNSP